MKSFVKFIFLLFVAINTACGQSNALNGVYAGLEVMPSGDGGMSRDDIAFLFRPDGTFTNKLNKPDWKTRVDGKYSLFGKIINIKYASNNRTTQYKLDKDGNIDAGGYDLIRQPTDSSVPAGYYKFSKTNSTGGGSSGMVYAGVGSDNNLSFDGKGHFSNSKASATAVIGNVGGGSSRKSSGKGIYKLNKGTLTLTFDDGRTETHSFFCRPGYKPVMAVIDGNIFFMEEEKEQQAKTSSRTTKRDPAGTFGEITKAEATTSGLVTDAKASLLKANAVHGGAALDKLKTIGLSATLQGMQVNSYVDVTARRVRLEVRQNGQLMQVEQLEGQSGWMWQKGKIGQLPAGRISVMGATFYSGILGLRKADIEALMIKNIKKTNSGIAISGEREGKQLVFLLNERSQLIGSADKAGRQASTSVYSDFRNTDGVLVPFQETNTVGQQKSLITYQKVEINPNYTEATWSKP